jgi:hypothetical protein
MDEKNAQQIEEEILKKCLTDHKYFIETFISIKDKKRFISPFIFNPIQNMFYDKFKSLNLKGIRSHIILKPRQLGFTTLVCALFLAECIFVPNTTAAIIAHDTESTGRIFEITKLMYDKLPDEIRPPKKYSTKKELVFEHLNSKIFVGTAGSEGFGRGTTINLLHCSEFAFWENPSEILPSLLETVPKDNGVIIYETTANGYNHFYDQYQESVSADENSRKLNQIPYPHFFRWFDHPEYTFDNLETSELNYIKETLSEEEESIIKVHNLTLGQIQWRRSKQHSLKDKFPQEYPEDDATCFVSSGKPFFDSKILKSIILWNEENKTWDKLNKEGDVILEKGWVKREANNEILIFKSYKPNENYILCVDPAEGNPTSDDSSAFILRLNKEPIFIEQCAEISGKIPMPRFWKLIYHLGALYNFPRIVIERNNHGHLLNYWAVNGFLQDQIQILGKYPKVYYAKDNKAGFVTTSASRPLILDNSAELLRNNMYVIYSKTWLNQALTFVYNENGKPEADKGKKDDAIISVAIGSFILIHEKQSSAFTFINKEDFGIGRETPKTSIYDAKKTMPEQLHPLDTNIVIEGSVEQIDWTKFLF